MSTEATVADYMSPSPHTVGAQQSAREALRRMRGHHIHHLPVLHGGELVGMVSERDTYFVVELADDADDVTVEEVMASEPYCVAPDDKLAEVAGTLAARRIGSAVVMQGREVVGVLTTTDALYALVDQLRAGSGSEFTAHRTEQRRLARHARLRNLVSTNDRAAAELLAGDTGEPTRAALERRLPRLLRVLAVEVAQDDAAAGMKSELDVLQTQAGRFPLTAENCSAVATEVHGSLVRLRGGLEARGAAQQA